MPRARAQHARYEEELRRLGCEVRRLLPLPACPDAVFVEAAANALRVGGAVRLERDGIDVISLGLSELIKAEGGVTCCGLIFQTSMLGG